MAVLNIIFLQPILNFLLALTNVLFGNFGLGVIALTIIVRLVLMPLTLMQLRSSKKTTEAMNAIKPKIDALKKKYAKNPQKLNQETMKLYKEAGISPLGCLSSPMLLSTVIQLPIYIALYRAIIQALAVTPQDFMGLSQNLYSWGLATEGLPVSGRFLWLNLGSADPFFVLPILVGVTQWITQKMIVQPTSDPQQQSMNNMMQIMMPLMMAFITMTLPSGLGLYFVVSSLIMMVIQYFVYGWGGLFAKKAPAAEAAAKQGGKPQKEKPDAKKAAGTAAAGSSTSPSMIDGLLTRFRRKEGVKKKPD
ncbi:MAG: YidC/Oxa1 family membrane protein insertase [Dehalococcoidia bacterium]|nr:YidC/Oxa1 family membrane protein insertase [Dehalococcoidia bacterium]